MGAAMTAVKMWINTDAEMAGCGFIRPEAVRSVTLDALVDTRAVTMPLIGQIPLEMLGLIVDPGSQEVRVRSEDGPRAFLLRIAA
jgi:hypothetical protein